jgi:membrane protein
MAGERAVGLRADAPGADDPRKPDSPKDIRPTSWKYALRKTIREFISDECPDIAASLTYYAVLSIFPAVIALVSLLGVFGGGREATRTILGIVQDLAPGSVTEVIRGPLEQFSTSSGAGWGLVVGLVVAVWSASRYVSAFSRAMNRIYEIEEGRPFWKLKPLQVLLTAVAIVVMLVIILILVVSGPVATGIGDALGIGEVARTVWAIAKWPLLAAAVVFLVALLYYATPNAKQPKFRWMSMGALLALVVLVVASCLFGLYLATFASFDKTYGPLGGVIIFLLWLWIADLSLLLGAEFDAELERVRQLQAGIAAEENIQLPPRDTKKSAKAADAETTDRRRGRRIRAGEDADG